MTSRRSTRFPPQPWSVPVAVEDIDTDSRHYDLAADESTRAAVASIAGVREVPRLVASFDVTRHESDGLRVAGRVSATVEQTCVITLEPVTNEVEEDIDLIYLPGAAAQAGPKVRDEPAEGPEPLIDGKVDLGTLATEFLVLGLDPYPRRPGAEFQSPEIKEAAGGPFAALATLKNGGKRQGS
jgi:uncharacterized metal-binding protein YceD (DUF177 family)